MSDIIDINVSKIVEQVEISVTENLTTVNVNTSTGVDAYTKQESNDIFIPLSGTEVGKPITGDLELLGNSELSIKQTFGDSNAIIGFLGNGVFQMASTTGVDTFGTPNTVRLTIDATAESIVFDGQNDSKGFSGTQDYSPNITDLDYTQKIYVDTLAETKLDASLYNDRYKGKFTSLANLEAALPTAHAGDYAQVDAGFGYLVANYNYDLEDGWILGGDGSGAQNTDALIEGSTNLYFTTARVLATLLSGLSVATGGAIVSTDSVLTAFGKLQKQITDNLAQLYWTRTGNDIANNNSGNVNLIVGLGGGNDGDVGIYDRNSPTIKTASISSAGTFRSPNFASFSGGAGIAFAGQRMIFSSSESSSTLPLFSFNPIYLGNGNAVPTTGELNVVGFTNQTVNPTSGNRIFNFFNLSPTINQTGGANGITRGIYINPTLTSAFDFRALEITNGKVIIPPATANNEAVNLSQLNLKANLANPTFTGSVVVPNAVNLNEAVNFSQLQSENNVYQFHDFLTSNPSVGFSFQPINIGIISFNQTNLTPNNPGKATLNSSTTANSGVSLRSSGNVMILKGQEVLNFIINPLTFANTTFRAGLHDSITSADANNGVYFEYSNSGNLTFKTANNGTRTTSATITMLSINTWYKLRITVNTNATSILAEVFNNAGSLIASVTHTSNIPSTARFFNWCAIATNSGTTATPLLDVDFMDLKQTLIR